MRKMRAIEYNTLKTMIKLLSDRLPSIIKEYNIKCADIPVLPSYPANLTSLIKPSIIVRKVSTRQSKIGLGNVLGQYFDKELNGYVDVLGKYHDIMIQFDIVAGNNAHRSLLESIITDDIFNKISCSEDGKFTLYDFTVDNENPTEMGNIQLIDEPLTDNLFDKKATNNDYIGIIRQNFAIVQTIVPNQEYVDLSKWIKQTYKIKL